MDLVDRKPREMVGRLLQLAKQSMSRKKITTFPDIWEVLRCQIVSFQPTSPLSSIWEVAMVSMCIGSVNFICVCEEMCKDKNISTVSCGFVRVGHFSISDNALLISRCTSSTRLQIAGS